MTDSAILNAAIDQFGRHGFDGASTRSIAKAADATMSSITYHFGGKDGLYLAAADHIAQSIAEAQRPAFAQVEALADGSPAGARQALLLIFDSFAQMMLRPESAPWARFILREQQEPTEAFERLYGGVMRGLSERIVALIAQVRPDLPEPAVRATGILMMGQAMILRGGRAAVCRVLGVEEIDDAAARLLRDRLRAHLLCILEETPK